MKHVGAVVLSSPIGGGGPRYAVEGVSPIHRTRRQAPSTTLRVVPLPRWGRNLGGQWPLRVSGGRAGRAASSAVLGVPSVMLAQINTVPVLYHSAMATGSSLSGPRESTRRKSHSMPAKKGATLKPRC